MNKVKTFLKNYKKTILGGLLALLVAVVLSMVANYFVYKYDIIKNNDTQLEMISEKLDEYGTYSDSLYGTYSEVISNSITVIADLLKLEPKDAYKDEFISNCQSCMTDNEQLLILDNNRKTINSTNAIRNIDYTAAYYDKLFTATEDKTVAIQEEGSDVNKSIAIRSGDYYVIVQNNTSDKTSGYVKDRIWKLAYIMVGVDTSSNFVVVDKTNNMVLYSDIEKLIGQKINKSNCSGWCKFDELGGEEYFVQSYDKRDDVRLLTITSRDNVVQRCVANISSIVACFTIVMIILIAYIVCLREEELNPEYEYSKLGKYFLSTQTKRYRALSTMIIIIAVAVLLILSNLNDAIFDEQYIKKQTNMCKQSADMYNGFIDAVYDNKCNIGYSCARLANAFLADHSDYMNKSGLASVADALGVKYVIIFNADGSTMYSSSSMDHINILEDTNSSLYELRYVLMGKEGVTVSGDPDKMSETETLYAVPRRNSEGIADGAIAIAIDSDESSTYNSIEDDIFELSRSGISSRIFIVNSKGKLIMGSLGDSTSFTVPKKTMEDGYNGRCILDNNEYLISVIYNKTADRYIYIALPTSRITFSLLMRGIISMLLLIIMVLWMGYDGLGSKYHFEQRSKQEKDADDWARTELLWEELSVGKKMGRVINALTYIIGIIIIVLWILSKEGLTTEYGLRYILSGKWDKAVNIYAVLGNLFVIIVCHTIASTVKYLIYSIETVIGEGSATMCRLLKSVVSYSTAIIVLFIVATNFGVDIITAAASVGVIGLALTLGAQELVKDMLSGMFILLEGKFKVGDMITLNGDWYWIKSIGVRTTVVEAWGQIRVINNSQMTGIVNIQNASSVVNIDIRIDHDVDIEEVKGIIMAELPALKENFPANVSTPTWKGVQDIDGSGVTIRMRTYCPPMSQGWVGRAMRQEIKRILDEHGIKPANDAINVFTE